MNNHPANNHLAFDTQTDRALSQPLGKSSRKSSKGSEFERHICKQLGRWWTQDFPQPRDDVFWRTAGSGGRATNRHKQGRFTAGGYGDLMAVDEIGKPFENAFVVELKRGYSGDIAILPLLDGGKRRNALLEFWDQVERDRLVCGRPWSLLVFKRDRMVPCLMLTMVCFRAIEQIAGRFPGQRIDIYHTREKLVVLVWDRFLEWFNPAHLSLL